MSNSKDHLQSREGRIVRAILTDKSLSLSDQAHLLSCSDDGVAHHESDPRTRHLSETVGAETLDGRPVRAGVEEPLPSANDGVSERDLAEMVEFANNDQAIDWEFWVGKMPRWTAAQAVRLMAALDPAKHSDLTLKRNETAGAAKEHAKRLELLAVSHRMAEATPAEWLRWADGLPEPVHTGFRIALAKRTGAENIGAEGTHAQYLTLAEACRELEGRFFRPISAAQLLRGVDAAKADVYWDVSVLHLKAWKNGDADDDSVVDVPGGVYEFMLEDLSRSQALKLLAEIEEGVLAGHLQIDGRALADESQHLVVGTVLLEPGDYEKLGWQLATRNEQGRDVPFALVPMSDHLRIDGSNLDSLESAMARVYESDFGSAMVPLTQAALRLAQFDAGEDAGDGITQARTRKWQSLLDHLLNTGQLRLMVRAYDNARPIFEPTDEPTNALISEMQLQHIFATAPRGVIAQFEGVVTEEVGKLKRQEFDPSVEAAKKGELTRAQRAEIVRRKKAGEKASDLAIEFGKSASFVYRLVRDSNQEPRKNRSNYAFGRTG
jgi:hypothetical protein